MFTIATSNVNFARSWRAHQRDKRLLLSMADVVCVQEFNRMPRWARLGRNAVFVRRGVKVIARGSRLAARDRMGYRIGKRRHAWKTVRVPGVGPVMVISVHMPPKRMWGPLYDAYEASLRDLIRKAESKGWEWIAAGDFNKLERADPAGLRRTWGAVWIGERIDLMAVSPDLAEDVQLVEARPTGRRDNHPIVKLTIR